MPTKVLWLDNDLAYIEPYVEAMKEIGYEVACITTVTQAERALKDNPDLLILDVMIPIKTDAEEERYRPQEIDKGRKTGLVFYKLNKAQLLKTGTTLLVLTVRLDQQILEEFLAAGLPRSSYDTKLTLREVGVFLKKVESILRDTKEG